jgi:D-alanyl-D-alanine carboxypeptidase/D-alanyl-D-alanine-endopeptidase (penicillin-binding protein 4)
MRARQLSPRQLVARPSVLGPLVLVMFGTFAAASPARTVVHSADAGLRGALDRQLAPAGPRAGAFVYDATSRHILYARGADRLLTPASNEKIYTTGSALLRFGGAARLRTAVLAVAATGPDGSLPGDLYLRGQGDPTFGSAAYVADAYGTGGTVEELARDLAGAGVRSVQGSVVGDESFFDRLRGTPADNYAKSFFLEGQLSGLAFNRGLSDSGGSFQASPATWAADRLTSALRKAGIRVAGRAREGPAPPSGRELGHVDSPTMSVLVRLTNRPSDNFFAETLLKDLGARFGAGGTTAAGAGVVRATLASHGVRPQRIVDGSGLSYADRTSPRQVGGFLTALRATAARTPFDQSLAVAGRNGTLAGRMNGTAAAGRCRGKTGTLPGVSALSGYCTSRRGHTLVFSILMNGVNVSAARGRQDRMAIALARYSGS